MPIEVRNFARHTTGSQNGTRAKLQALLEAIFRSQAEGGLGLTYDNTYTRTVAEVWRDRKANCLSLTAFYVAACDSLGIQARFAEALNTNRWRRVGTVVRLERHIVALVELPPLEDVVADFLPQLRKRVGVYRVAVIGDSRVRALFYANRAVEELDKGQTDEALVTAKISVEMDSSLSVGWNIYGVVLKSHGKFQDAEAAFRKALRCDPRDSSAIGNMQALMREQGRFEEAIRYRLLELDVRKKDPYFNAFLAEEALAEGNVDGALTLIRKAIKLLPYESEFFLTQARVNILLGKTDLAVKDLEEAKKWAVPGERERFDSKLTRMRESEKEKSLLKK
ncbi:MAG: transglutaminase domain-containing protein [Holophaga sp.]|nr:transglutaminase domain-containing protein [Holophaga sp.]